MNKKITLLILCLTFSLALLFLSPQTAHASFLNDIVNGVKNLFSPQTPKQLNVNAKIELAPDGDVNKNGQIDAGDTVRYTYVVTNTTDQEYLFATLKTNIDRKQLDFIHNITGTVNLNDDGETITIPNFHIAPNQVEMITFDARVNYSVNADPTLTTEADFIDSNNTSVSKSARQQIKANRINNNEIPRALKQLTKEGNSK